MLYDFLFKLKQEKDEGKAYTVSFPSEYTGRSEMQLENLVGVYITLEFSDERFEAEAEEAPAWLVPHQTMKAIIVNLCENTHSAQMFHNLLFLMTKRLMSYILDKAFPDCQVTHHTFTYD